MKALIQRVFGGFKGILFILAVAVGFFLHLYTQHIVGQLRDEARSLVQFYAQMIARVAETESSSDLSFLFDEIIQRTNFPLIQTDSENTPVGWKEIDVDPRDHSPDAMERGQKILRQMEREGEPVKINYSESQYGFLYYGDSKLIWRLQWVPYVQVGIIGFFILLGLVGSAQIRQSEQRHIWVGMAKETAHQLGTPISSLLGWLEILKSGPVKDQEQMIVEMEKDIKRLGMVTNRFSQIGSRPDLQEMDPLPILKNVIDYIKRRAPQSGKRVEIKSQLEPLVPVRLNPGLFQWAIENVLKNALDAMDKPEGKILIRAGQEPERRRIWVEIEDNGKGLDKSQAKKIFKPGFSTKKRGWGLGLSLARRIIKEYHGGKMVVKWTQPGRGVIMRIELKVQK